MFVVPVPLSVPLRLNVPVAVGLRSAEPLIVPSRLMVGAVIEFELKVAEPVTLPVSVPLTPKFNVPDCRLTVPVLLNGRLNRVSPVPVSLRNVPALLNAFVPPD